MNKLAFAISLALLPAVGQCELTPAQGRTDSRIRVVNYDPMQVVNINTFYGIATRIKFGAEEKIDSVIFGDEEAWDKKEVHGNILVIKPKAEHADTNLSVITNKREYSFFVGVVNGDRRDPSAYRSHDVFYALNFKYKEVSEKRSEEIREQIEEKKKEIVAERFEETKERIFNDSYFWRGDYEIAPDKASDDGSFVTLQFKYAKDMPAVYELEKDGKEAKVSYHVEDNKMILEKLVKHFVLRRGEQVAEVVTYSQNIGVSKEAGTINSSVVREVAEVGDAR